jgi:surfactin synthase thioesterase subunit
MYALYALAAYRPPQGPVAARLTFVRAADSALGEKHAEYYRRLPAQDFASVVLPGDHFSILSADRSRQLAECFADPTGWRTGEMPEDQ